MLNNEHGIFTDITDREGNIVQTAEDVYKDCLLGKNTNKIDICSTPTIEEQLLATQKMLLSLQEQIIDMA